MDELHEAGRLDDVLVLLKRNINYILYAVIGIAVIGGILLYIRQRGVEREITARTALEEAKRSLRENEADEGIEYLQTVIRDYDKTEAFGEALLYRGRAEIVKGDYEEAVGYLAEYIEARPGGELLPDVYSELGFIFEKKGDFEEAERYYSLVFREFPESYLAPKSLADAARCLEELGEYEQAKMLYESLLSSYPWSSFAETAVRRLETLDPGFRPQDTTQDAPLPHP